MLQYIHNVFPTKLKCPSCYSLFGFFFFKIKINNNLLFMICCESVMKKYYIHNKT